MSSLMEVPLELLERIFGFLQDNTLIGMRKVCKRTKELAEAAVLNRRTQFVVDRLAIHSKRETDIHDIIVQLRFEHNNQSKLMALCALSYLKIAKMEYNCNEINVEMPFTDLAPFFTRLAPLFRGVEYKTVHIMPSNVEVLETMSNVLRGKRISSATLALDESDNSRALIHLVQQLRPTNLRVRINDFATEVYLVKLAKMVKAFAISTSKGNWLSNKQFGSRTNSADVFTFAQKVLLTRCSYLDLSDTRLELAFTDNEANCVRAAFIWDNKPGKTFYFASRSFAYSAGFSDAGKELITAKFGNPRDIYW